MAFSCQAQAWLSPICVCLSTIAVSVRWYLSKLRALGRIKRSSPVVIGLCVSRSSSWDGGEQQVCDIWHLKTILDCLFLYRISQAIAVYSSSLFCLPKDRSTVPACNGGKQAGGSTSKANISYGRSNSLTSRDNDSTANGNKDGGSLKRGSLGRQASTGHQITRQVSRPARPAIRLCSSRSFSSLHSSSLTAAPFKRSSRSLNRLDQRSSEDGKLIDVWIMYLCVLLKYMY